jgi:hypothetical protein
MPNISLIDRERVPVQYEGRKNEYERGPGQYESEENQYERVTGQYERGKNKYERCRERFYGNWIAVKA